jgi:hypothetical protein
MGHSHAAANCGDHVRVVLEEDGEAWKRASVQQLNFRRYFQEVAKKPSKFGPRPGLQFGTDKAGFNDERRPRMDYGGTKRIS